VPSKPAIALTALLALIAVLIPYAGASALSKSQDLAQAADLHGALEQAQTAANIEPFAATPALQQALILEADGDLAGAAHAATQATEDEPTNWRTWLVLSRVQAYRGEAEAAVSAYEKARALNPRSNLFTNSQ
jgi:Flp pilus assembly protein TadD